MPTEGRRQRLGKLPVSGPPNVLVSQEQKSARTSRAQTPLIMEEVRRIIEDTVRQNVRDLLGAPSSTDEEMDDDEGNWHDPITDPSNPATPIGWADIQDAANAADAAAVDNTDWATQDLSAQAPT